MLSIERNDLHPFKIMEAAFSGHSYFIDAIGVSAFGDLGDDVDLGLSVGSGDDVDGDGAIVETGGGDSVGEENDCSDCDEE